jgi:putative membrane protein
MKEYLILVLKGIGMGAANVIPGVSGGTIALITGIFERLIHTLKSFNLKAIKLFLNFKFKEFAAYTDLKFLLSILIGVLIAIISLAHLFDFLFVNYPIYIWAYFFGLVLASVYFVGKTIGRWNASVVSTFIIGILLAVFISFLNPASENQGFLYLILCGVVAICSMILPGLSGSFVLILMGNYKLVVIDSINDFNIKVLLPVIIGAGFGLIAFSHLLSWVFKKFRDQTISILTGFILGSVSILWPWQNKTYLENDLGQQILKKGEPIIVHYERVLPDSINLEFFYALGFIIFGILSIWLIELNAKKTI